MLSVTQSLKRLCRLWQKRLKLADWDIDVHLVDAEDADLSGDWGWVDWFVDSQGATIKISTAVPENQIEEILVHELVHIIIGGHAPPTKYSVHEERAVNALSEALCVGFRRRKRKNGDKY